MEKCPIKNDKTVHNCGPSRIKILNNLVQKATDVVGEKRPVKIEIYPCQEVGLVEAGHLGEEAARRFM